MKKVRILQQTEQGIEGESAEKPSMYVFYNKITGAAQFRAEALAGEQDSIERAAGLLAIQCLVRGQDPENFVVLVPAPNALSESLVSRAK